MSSSHDVGAVDQSSTANIHRLFRIFLQDGHLPWVLSKFTVSIYVRRCLNSSIDTLRVSDTTLTTVGGLRTEWFPAAYLMGFALLHLWSVAEVSLTLKKSKKTFKNS